VHAVDYKQFENMRIRSRLPTHLLKPVKRALLRPKDLQVCIQLLTYARCSFT